VVKQDQKGEQFLICFLLNKDKVTALLIDQLRSIQTNYYTSIVDYENNGVYNQPLNGFSKSYSEQRFPSTFYKWILQAVPRNYNELEREVRNQRRANLFFIILSMSLIFFSLAVIYGAASRERQLRQLKEDFIGNVSHELKTPLSLIRMFSEILVTGRVKSEEAKREYYSVIHNESDRMGRLVNNLLDFASLEKDKKRKYFEKTNIPGLVQKALEAYRYEFQREGFQLTSEIDESVPDTLADPNAISMAFFNLLDNSMKYSAEQKEIRVVVSRANEEIRISVADRGLGIPIGEQQKIFEKFYRGSSAQLKRTRGSGIGLAITKQVAEMHGGGVLVESETGKGSTFTLTIPMRCEPSAANLARDTSAHGPDARPA
jgi:two-component system phosphate regulon sensor histidine kinase PhoR